MILANLECSTEWIEWYKKSKKWGKIMIKNTRNVIHICDLPINIFEAAATEAAFEPTKEKPNMEENLWW